MKKIFLFMFSLLIMFSLCTNIEAILVSGEGHSGSSFLPITTEDIQHNLPGGMGNNFVGIRISFVNGNGSQITSSDYVIRLGGITNSKYNQTGKNPSKYYSAQIEAKTSQNINSINFKLKGNKYTSVTSNLKQASELEKLFKKYGFRISTSELISDMAYKTSLAASWFDQTNYTGSNYQGDLKNLLLNFVPEENVSDPEKLKNLFFVVEPTTIIEIKNTFSKDDKTGEINDISGLYYGTHYQLASFANKVPDKGGASTALRNSFADLLRLAMPCSSYLKGDLLDVIHQYEDVNLPQFSYNYFGNIKKANDYIINKCTNVPKNPGLNDRLTAETINDSYGIGMAVVWFYDKITPTPEELNNPTCDDVEKILGSFDNVVWNNEQITNQVNKFNNQAESLKFNKITSDFLKDCLNISPDLKDPVCEDVEKVLGINFKTGTFTDYLKTKYFTEFNKIAPDKGFNYIQQGFIENCISENQPVSYNCSPKYNVGSCMSWYGDAVIYDDTDGRIDDEDYWNNCVFNDKGTYDNDNHKTTYLDESLGDKDYCPVYCVEELRANFDSQLRSVSAGGNFVWPNGSFITGSRTCKTKKIDWTKFKSDLDTANNQIKNTYIAWKLEEALSKAEPKKTEEICSSVCVGESYEEIEVSPHRYPNKIYYINGNITDGTAGWIRDGYKCKLKDTREPYDYEPSDYKLVEMYDCVKTEQKKVCSGGEQKVYYYTKTATFMDKSDTRKACGINGSYSIYVDLKKSQYDQSIKYADGLVEKMRNCNNLANANVYSTNSQLNLSYTQGGYNYSGYLDRSISTSQSSSPECKANSDAKIQKCSGSSCSLVTINDLQKCTEITTTGSSTQIYSLNQKVYRYVLKVGYTSLHVDDYNENYSGQSYIDIGHGNLPVRYNTQAGFKSGGLTINYSNLGHIKNSGLTTEVDSILKSVNSEDYGNWVCGYEVVDGLIPGPIDKKGIKVIYRPIDINNPFPNIDSNGRNTGSNWCDGENCRNDNNIVKEVITDKKDILNQEPMYSFVLTPQIIKKIRSYNKNNDYDDFNLKCEQGTGNACISSFVTDLIKGTVNNASFDASPKGTCINDTVRVPKQDFYNCRTYPKK